jgi:hypothetical protein
MALNTVTTWGPLKYREEASVLLVVDANAGTVTVSYELDPGTWIVVDTVSTDTFKTYPVRNNKIRFTPTGAAVYAVYGV